VASPQDSVPPAQFPNVPPPDMSGTAAQTRIIAKEVVQAVESSLNDVKTNIAEIKSDIKTIKDHRWTDFMWHIAALVACFAVIATAIVTSYFRLEDKIATLSTSNTRLETRLDDLIQRIPPIPTSVPRR
jgi:hypothetical protein